MLVLPIEICNNTQSKVNIEDIVGAIRGNRVRITDHADEEAQLDQLTYEEIYVSVINGEVIEDYPDDRPYPSCLIFGELSENEPVHSVWAYNQDILWAVLVTVYRPDPSRWINWRERRTEN